MLFWIVAIFNCWVKDQGSCAFLGMTFAVVVTVDVLLWFRLFKVEAMSVRVLFEAGRPCVTIVHQTCNNHEVRKGIIVNYILNDLGTLTT